MRLLKSYITIVLYCVLLTPLMYCLLFSSSYIFTQVHFFETLVLVLLLPLTFLWIFEPTTRPRWNMISIGLVVFPLSLLILNSFSLTPITSFLGVWHRFGGAFDWLIMSVYAFALLTVVTSRKEALRYCRFAVLVSAGVSVFGLLQYSQLIPLFYTGTRVFSTIGNPAFLASYLVLASGLTFYCFFNDARKLRCLYILIALLQFSVLLLTYARAALLGYLFAISIIVFLYYRARGTFSVKRFERLRFVGLALIVVSVAGIGIYTLSTGRSYGIGFHDQTIQTRLINWRTALSAISAKPMVGWGDGNYSYAFQRYYDPRLYIGVGQNSFFDKSHNEFLDRAVETGFIGLVAYLFFILAPIACSLKRMRKLFSIDDAVLISFSFGYYVVIFFLFHSIADVQLLMIFFLLAYSIRESGKKPLSQKNSGVAYASIALSISLALVIMIRPVAANYLVRRGEVSINYSERIYYFRHAWPMSIPGQYAIINSLLGPLPAQIRVSEQIEAREQLRAWMSLTLQRDTQDVRLMAALARLLQSSSSTFPERTEQALALAKIALVYSPRDPQVFQLIGTIYHDIALSNAPQRSESFKNSLDNFYAAYALAPENLEARVLWIAASADVSGKTQALHNVVHSDAPEFSEYIWYVLTQKLMEHGDQEGVFQALQALEKLDVATYPYVINLKSKLTDFLAE